MKTRTSIQSQVKSLIRHHVVNLTLSGKRLESGIILTEVKFLDHEDIDGAAAGESHGSGMKEYDRLLKGYLSGAIRSLDAIPIDTTWCTSFQKKILDTARAIPWGCTVSYGELAAKAGHASAVRAVASVMRNNRFPIIVPCHRVIGANGKPGGFMGATSGAPVALKMRLLALEGIRLNR